MKTKRAARGVLRRTMMLACVAACATDASSAPDTPMTVPPRRTSDDGGAPAPVADAAANDDADGAAGCDPVRRFTYTSTAVRPLGCDGNTPTVIIDEAVPTKGRALGRATFDVRLANGSVIHFWNLRVAIGKPLFAYGLGDDLCPGTTARRSNIGLGALTTENDHARLVGHAGAAPCTPGAVEVLAGAKLEVWVEDSRDACTGKDIAFGSWYGSKGVTDYDEWTTSMAPMPGAVATVTTEAPDEKLRVIGVVEGSPAMNPNATCGAEAATLVMQTTLDGAIMATSKNVVPASGGMGHLVLFTSGDAQEVRAVKPGPHDAKLLVGSNFVGTVRTGGCCGDGSVALVRER